MSSKDERDSAQNVIDLLHVAHDDSYAKTFDLEALVVHWANSPLPAERLAAEYVRRWLIAFHREGDHHQILSDIIIDLSDGSGGEKRRNPPPLKASFEIINRDTWAVFCEAYSAWVESFKTRPKYEPSAPKVDRVRVQTQDRTPEELGVIERALRMIRGVLQVEPDPEDPSSFLVWVEGYTVDVSCAMIVMEGVKRTTLVAHEEWIPF